jgi:hypothetical protein
MVITEQRRVSMKVTFDMPDGLCRHARGEAARRGCELEDLIEEGLRRVLATRGHLRLADLVRHAQGVVDSGISDLGSNDAHLAHFGRETGRHR